MPMFDPAAMGPMGGLWGNPMLQEPSKRQQWGNWLAATLRDAATMHSPEGGHGTALQELQVQNQQRQLLQHQAQMQQQQQAQQQQALGGLQLPPQLMQAVRAGLVPVDKAMELARGTPAKDRYMNVPNVGLVDLERQGGPQVALREPEKKEPGTAAHQDALNLGLQPGTPQYADYIRTRTLRPPAQTNIQVGSPEFGPVPPGFQLMRRPDGSVAMEPIEGSPAAKESAERSAKEAETRRADALKSDVIVTDIDRAKSIINTSRVPVTGWGSMLQHFPGPARNVSALIDTVKANTGFDALQRMRNASPTGGALGNITEKEIAYLQATVGNLELSQSKDQLLFNLDRVRDAYAEIVHGPGSTQANANDGWTTLPNGIRIRERR